MRLFKRKKEEKQPQRHELMDIPIGSMIELSDTTTFALEEKTTQTYELSAYKKYEAEDFLRYMYQLVNDEEVILGVNVDPAGAPVPAVGLEELDIEPEKLAARVMEGYSAECESIEIALRKVRGVE